MPAGVVAYYSNVSNHVVMYERGKLNQMLPLLADQQAAATIAHEGIHQILHSIGVQQRLAHWPIWISEGLAEYFAPTSTDERSRWKRVGKVNDMRMFELDRYLKHPRRRAGRDDRAHGLGRAGSRRPAMPRLGPDALPGQAQAGQILRLSDRRQQAQPLAAGVADEDRDEPWRTRSCLRALRQRLRARWRPT